MVNLYILIYLGYYVKPKDGSHFVKLFADAQFYSCGFPYDRQDLDIYTDGS